MAKLAGGVAVLKIGAATEPEMKEKKARVEDALHATRAAVEEGIVPGGGVAYIRAIAALDKVEVENEDQKIGVQIVQRALEEPLRQIAANAGWEGSIVVQRVKEGQGDFGFNAQTEEFGNLLEQGVIDPTKVARTALENAASVAGLLLTTEPSWPKSRRRKRLRRRAPATWTSKRALTHPRNPEAGLPHRQPRFFVTCTTFCLEAVRACGQARSEGPFCVAHFG